MWKKLLSIYLPTYLLLVAADQVIKYKDPYIDTGVVNVLIFSICVILASLLIVAHEDIDSMRSESKKVNDDSEKTLKEVKALFDSHMSKTITRIGAMSNVDMGKRLMYEISEEYEKNKKEEGWVRPFTEM